MSKSRQGAGPQMRTSWVAYAERFAWRRHRSEWAQLVFASRGAMTVSTASGIWVVPPHQAVWVPPRVQHDVEVPAHSAMRMLYVKPPYRRRLPAACRAVNISPLLRELLRRAFAVGTLNRRKREQRNLMEVLLDELALLPLAPIDLPMPRDERALRAARFMRENPGATETLASVSRHAGASTRTLERLFRAETGLSLGAWRQRARLLRALQLLADDASVTSTAVAVGYESTSAFVAAFQRTIGVTPGRYFKRSAAGAEL
jgi:AraC-like DNA-binding protein